MSSTLLFSFALAQACAGWTSIDDVVMGGRSGSRVECTQAGTLRFHGGVSLENNGGFASVRSPAVTAKLDGHSGLRLRLKGDGKSYKLNLRTDLGFDGTQYQASFPTTGAWQEIDLPFGAFVPRFRGRAVEAPPLAPERIASVGLLISDRQTGPFVLDVAWIEAYR